MMRLVVAWAENCTRCSSRPQRQQEKSRKAQIEALKKGDRVVTRGGILGIVSRVKEDEVIVRIDEDGKVRVPFSKTAIEQVLTKDAGDAK